MTMVENYSITQKELLQKAWARPQEELARALPGHWVNDSWEFPAFGESCQLRADRIFLGKREITGPEGILIALYASWVKSLEINWHPLKSFKELPGSFAYQGGFTANAERSLEPYVPNIKKNIYHIISQFNGQINLPPPSGDFSFALYPLPRVGLYYIFYLPDDEFPASVTCLFPANAEFFLPVAALADVAEYTAKKIIQLIQTR